LRMAMPGMTISTDIIVGFPGESVEDFRQTLSLIEQAQFDWAFIFKYSTRDGTPAAEWESFSDQLVEERHQECLSVVESVAAKKRLALVGTDHEVLLEAENFGRTRTNIKVRVDGNVARGETVKVRIVGTDREIGRAHV